jgi:hypothetical protein
MVSNGCNRADRWHDDTSNWYPIQFDAVTKPAGIKVQHIEGGK